MRYPDIGTIVIPETGHFETQTQFAVFGSIENPFVVFSQPQKDIAFENLIGSDDVIHFKCVIKPVRGYVSHLVRLKNRAQKGVSAEYSNSGDEGLEQSWKPPKIPLQTSICIQKPETNYAGVWQV
jgi:hypothetical protein